MVDIMLLSETGDGVSPNKTNGRRAAGSAAGSSIGGIPTSPRELATTRGPEQVLHLLRQVRNGKASYCKKCTAIFDPVLAVGAKVPKCPKNHPNFMYSKKIPELKLKELEDEEKAAEEAAKLTLLQFRSASTIQSLARRNRQRRIYNTMVGTASKLQAACRGCAARRIHGPRARESHQAQHFPQNRSSGAKQPEVFFGL